MAQDARIFRINYKSDFILTLESDAGWMTPFCIKFWTGAPSQAYYVSWDGETYNHCSFDPSEPTKLLVQFDDHHLPIGELKYQVAYHFTVADFPNDTEDEVLNQANITTEIDGQTYQVMLDFTGETAPEIQFSLPAYANEAQRIANEQHRIVNETQRISNEETRIQHEQQRIAQEQTRQQNEQQRINQEQARVDEYAGLKADAVAATGAANDAAALANQKAQLADDKAALAQDAADLANAKAQLAADKAALAASAAQLANDKAALAQQKAEYAQTQGDYAKAQGDYAKNQGDTALADHQRAEADHGIAVDDHTQAGNDHTRAESDHGIAVDDHTQAGNDHTRAESDHGIAADDHTQAGNDHTRAESDHGIAADDHTQAGNDHTRAESDHTRAESDHDAVELYVDSLGVFDLSKHNAVGGVLATYADLSAALTALNALESKYKYGGMSFKYVQTSDNNYVKFFCTAQNFTTDVTQWQGVDDEPTAGSDNLVKSGGVVNYAFNNTMKLEGFVSCEIANFNNSAVLDPTNKTRASVFCKKGIKKISLHGQTDLKFAVFGNNAGPNHYINSLTDGWITEDFINDTDYKYIFIKVAYTNETSEFVDAPDIYIEFFDYNGILYTSYIEQNSSRPVSLGLFSNFVKTSSVKMSGEVSCKIGSFNTHGIISGSSKRAYLIIRGLKKVTLNNQSNLKYYIYGNYSGVGFDVTLISDGWTTEDFVNNTDYNYIFIMVAQTDDTVAFSGAPSLYVEFSDYRGVSSISQDEEYIEKPLSTGAFGDIMTDVGHKLTSNPVEDMKRLTLIIIYGQSLSIGQDSVAISTEPNRYNNALMFKQGVTAREQASSLLYLSRLVEQTVETPARGLSEAFVESIQQENMFDRFSNLWSEKQLILACPGVGGATIDQLTDNNYYQYFENIITAAKNFCDGRDFELDIPVWCWMQGENDIKTSMSTSTYKSKLLALQNKVCNSIETITGITKRPKCIVYQPNCQSLYKTGDTGTDNQFDFDYDHMGVPTAFMELVRDNNEFIASAPTYICDPCAKSKGWWVHCDAKSYKLLGAMLGYNIKKYLVDGISNKGVVPMDISVSGNTIKLKYNVPCPPLCFDTNYVREAPHMGFNVIKADNSNIISNVSLFNDTVTIECSESPVGCKLRYGMNGDFIITSRYRGISGREHGGRGNLRDCQGNYFYKEIEGCKYPLHNWAYTFECLIS